MHKIVLFLNTTPQNGGSFQYDQTILGAVLALPFNQYKIIILYTDDVWKQYLPAEIAQGKINIGALHERIIQILIMLGVSANLLRRILRYIDPVVREIHRHHADLYVFPCQTAIWGYLIDVAYLITIHDLMHRYEKKFTEVSGIARFRYRDTHLANVCKYSKGILAESSVGKEHIVTSYKILYDKIHVLPYIAPPHFRALTGSENLNSFCNLPQKYVFYPAQFWRHKNHSTLIHAIDIVSKEIQDIKLVLVGAKKNAYQAVIKLVDQLHLNDKIIIYNYIPDQKMAAFYRHARALIMPTFCGPTNIPPLEAFAAGCPVAVSNIYGMPEQVGDAALLFDPRSVEDITKVIKLLWENDDLCQELIRKGKLRDAHWEEGAFNRRFAEIISNVMDN
jgi:glycosyltransferase involved in cell wall biosynthesis